MCICFSSQEVEERNRRISTRGRGEVPREAQVGSYDRNVVWNLAKFGETFALRSMAIPSQAFSKVEEEGVETRW